ncbi:EGF domain-specific O-linked N-acetylglucosamine transferase-like [Haliotis cracherodii]|uniref:EGF domain-specific O-linked N-acetylglucosamine transferase-like n=1 Tax=Haliotis cracherodii TaxID=6455 RepID=UPI0039EC639B
MLGKCMHTQLLPLVVFSLVLVTVGGAADWGDLRLPPEHVPYFFRNNPHIKQRCQDDEACPYKAATQSKRCWGYEKSCPENQRMSTPRCSSKERRVSREESNLEIFWKQADFGLVKERKAEYKYYCKPAHKDDSSLRCVDHTRYCRATNLYLDFRGANMKQSNNRYREDLLDNGKIGGHCQLDKASLARQGDHKSPLQSWYAEVEHFTSLESPPLTSGVCDIIIEKPTYLIKLDAGVNMFHHFCDYVNLYLSQHFNNSFSTDVNIVMWDTSGFHYGDFFSATWKVFSDHPIIPLQQYDGKRVCFKEAVFSFLARTRLGLYYNMPLVNGCEGSGLIRAFSQHTIHRLDVPQDGPLRNKVRVTVLARNTKYRNILNQDELVSALKTVGEFEVKLVVFNKDMPFLDQLKISHNSDIFIGMHGAGLTHLLFQPDWAVVFEIYNCEDPRCYYDLARLRGISYITWERQDKLDQEDEGHHPTLGAHAKFTNYGFDVNEFLRLVFQGAQHVKSHPSYITAHQEKHGRNHKSKDEL